MKVHAFGPEGAPVIVLLPGTCCHWKSNFGHVIPLLADTYRVLCVSYDGFDEAEQTKFPTMTEETEKIENYIQMFGYNKRAHIWHFVIYIPVSTAAAWLCTLL